MCIQFELTDAGLAYLASGAAPVQSIEDAEVGDNIVVRLNGRAEHLVYWGKRDGEHIGKTRPLSWVDTYFRAEQFEGFAA